MSIRRITISVPSELAAKVKKAAGARPVSAYITSLIEEKLEDDRLEAEWERYVRDVHERATPEEVARADAMFQRVTSTKKRSRRAA